MDECKPLGGGSMSEPPLVDMLLEDDFNESDEEPEDVDGSINIGALYINTGKTSLSTAAQAGPRARAPPEGGGRRAGMLKTGAVVRATGGGAGLSSSSRCVVRFRTVQLSGVWSVPGGGGGGEGGGGEGDDSGDGEGFARMSPAAAPPPHALALSAHTGAPPPHPPPHPLSRAPRLDPPVAQKGEHSGADSSGHGGDQSGELFLPLPPGTNAFENLGSISSPVFGVAGGGGGALPVNFGQGAHSPPPSLVGRRASSPSPVITHVIGHPPRFTTSCLASFRRLSCPDDILRRGFLRLGTSSVFTR